MLSSEFFAGSTPSIQVVRLRQFPAEPAEGETEGVKWEQTMGKMTLSYLLEGEGLSDDAVSIQLSAYELQVNISGKKLATLSGDLAGTVMPGRSWWKVHHEEVNQRVRREDHVKLRTTLVVQLAKQEHKAWPGLWYKGKSGMMHPLARGRFPWTEDMHDEDTLEAVRATLAIVPPGAPTGGMAGPSQFAPDDVCIGIDVDQTDDGVTVRVHFDSEALRIVQQSVMLEEFLAADVWENQLDIHLQGYSHSPILLAQLWGKVCPEMSSWKMTTSDLFRSRQRDFSAPAPALLISLVKSRIAHGRWPVVLVNCQQHRLLIKNYGDLEAIMYALQADAAAQQALEAKAQAEEASGEAAIEAIQAALLTEVQRQELQRRLEGWREERFEGLPGAQLVQRSCMDFQDPDFASHVSRVVDEITHRSGCTGGARWSSELGRFSYVY